MPTERTVPEELLRKQYEYIDLIAARNAEAAKTSGRRPRAVAHTFGCQQNFADTERIAGMLSEMGYDLSDDVNDAELILYNTCAVREHAESRALGNVGALTHVKKAHPETVIALCGCMVQQKQVAEKVKKSYPHVDLVFGTHALWRFPELLFRTLAENKRVFDISGDEKGEIAEGLPVLRGKGARAWLSIMYGCNNFCTYCIVPYVGGSAAAARMQLRRNCVNWLRRAIKILPFWGRMSTHTARIWTTSWIFPGSCGGWMR